MVERLLTHASSHDEHLQVLHHLALAAEAVERERAQGVLIVALRLRRCAGSLAYVEFSHRCVLVTSDELQVTSGTFAQPALGLAAFAGMFAQPAQVSRRLPRRLRSPRKFRGVCRDVCAARASLAAFAGAFAQPAQVSRRLPRRLRSPRWVLRRLPGRLRSLRKSRGVCRDVCAACDGSCGINRKKRGNKPAKSCSLSLLPNRRMSTLYPPSSTLY